MRILIGLLSLLFLAAGAAEIFLSFPKYFWITNLTIGSVTGIIYLITEKSNHKTKRNGTEQFTWNSRTAR